MERVIVGLSGGVDSAAAALLLLEQGYEVTGVTLRTWEGGESRCCRIDAARETAAYLGIPYRVISCASEFRRQVEEPFAEAYLRGLTPNPCVRCNAGVKWEWMGYAAGVLRADRIATGHYAAVAEKHGSYFLREGSDPDRDQSYMLCRLTPEQLAVTLFPLGERTKTEVRRIAEEAGLPTAATPDSQEICFVTEGGYAEHIAACCPGRMPEPGNFVDSSGRILGRHRGIVHYTVGQRRGLGLALGRPVYVKELRPERREILVTEESGLWEREILCEDVRLREHAGAAGELRARVKIRSHDRGTPARITAEGPDRVRIRFDRPVRAPAPGQWAVFLDGDRCVVGSGRIRRSAGDG